MFKQNSQNFKSKSALYLAISIFCLILAAQTIQAATLNVPSTQYPTIQSAVNAANAGDIIILQAGVTFTESVVLKYKSGSDYITIQSSALSSLPPDGQRVSPSHAQFMPKIVPPNGGSSAILTEITANGPSHHYRLLGIEMAQTNSSQLIYSMVSLGSSDSDQNTLAKVAHHFIIDRCYIHGHTDGELRRGIALNSEYTNIVNSYISDVHQVEDDSQAIGGWNGPGQYLIENNYLEAATENILFGGSDPAITNLVPSDIVIRHNLVTKKLSWYSRTPAWKVKNILELKNARRVTIVENIFENNWANAQSGFGILFTVRNQSGTAPWSTIEDVTFNYNIVRNTPSSISVLAQDYKFPSQNVENLSINYNLISSISTFPLNPDAANGKCVQVLGGGSLGTQNLTLNHNTCVGFGSYPAFIYGDSDSSIKVTGLDVKNNIAMGLNAGTDATISGNAQPSGTPSLNAMTANTWTLQKNILMLPSGSSTYPNSSPNLNYYVTNSGAVGFVDFANGNYALSSSSPYRNLGTDGTDPGANIALLNQKKPCIESGNWSSCGSSSSQTPYPGPTAPTLPATIEVEKFDTGGQNVAYNDTFGSTGSGAYRTNPTETVDVLGYSNASNGFAVFEAAAGEWLEYTINVPSPGLYNFKTRYASGYTQPNSQGKFKIEVCEPAPNDGIANCISSGDITVNSTGGWNTFQTVTRLFSLPSAGTRILRLTMVANAPGDGTPCNCVVANFDSIAISKGRTLFDYDGDGKADVSIFRPSEGKWYLSQSSAGGATIPFGASGDIVTPGDYDGDGKNDVAVFRPSNSTWYIRRSSDLGTTTQQWGVSGDIPATADYDGDGKDDIAIYRPSSGQWWILRSTLGTIAFTFGNSTDKPVQGDYTGDGKADVAVWRPSTGEWYILRSEDYSYYSFPFGANGDTPVTGDFDGDGKSDAAIFRSSTSTWYVQRSTAGTLTFGFGQSGDNPVPADYDGDGMADIALFRPTSSAVWHLQRTALGYISQGYGFNTDIPTPSAYIH